MSPTTYEDNISSGKMNSVITDPTGARTAFSQTGLTSFKTLPDGTAINFRYEYDPEYNYPYNVS